MKPFTADMFCATRWDSAEDKACFANTFVRFVERGFQRKAFTQKFYRRLQSLFSHMAHMDADGFYDEWFASEERRYRFVMRLATQRISNADPSVTWSDVEGRLKEWLRNSEIPRKAQADFVEAEVDEREERAELARLKEKYELAG